MTELSFAAAKDEVDRLILAIENVGKKSERLNSLADQAREDQARLEEQLSFAQEALRVAEERSQVVVSADTADGYGSN